VISRDARCLLGWLVCFQESCSISGLFFSSYNMSFNVQEEPKKKLILLKVRVINRITNNKLQDWFRIHLLSIKEFSLC